MDGQISQSRELLSFVNVLCECVNSRQGSFEFTATKESNTNLFTLKYQL